MKGPQVVLCILTLVSMGCGEKNSPSNLATPTSSPVFAEAAEAFGLTFQTSHAGSGKRYFIEISAGGCALFDFDGDGWLDCYFVNGAATPGYEGPLLKNALYRNRGDGTFEDVTESTRSGHTGYGCGCAVGDIDNDGDLDLFIANFGNDTLLRNDGDKGFTDISSQSSFRPGTWSTSAAFLDYDRDDDLDLYVCHYVAYDLDNPPVCLSPDGYREYCNPSDFDGVTDALYRNDGSGHFVEVSDEAKVGDPDGRGYGVTVGDFDNDGDVDLYIANDQSRNNLYVNNADGTFTDVGLFAGVGYGVTGAAEAGMGCDFGDFDGDGWLDLIVTNFSDETNSLYRNLGDGLFTDETLLRGLGEPTSFPLGFGTDFFDYDGDGDLDLLFICGHVLDTIERHGTGETYAQTDLLLENRDGFFVDVSAEAGSVFQTPRVGRASATGDLDNDGDLDIVVTHVEGSISVYRNDSPSHQSCLLLNVLSKHGSPAIGARVIAHVKDRTLLREVRGAASFQAHQDLRVHVGLGDASEIDKLEIHWPSGEKDVFHSIGGNAILTIHERDGLGNRTAFQTR